jgi:AraC family transcriptional regulator, regulatory protein of adaptative response / methylated-DNA-[protein]-cysteine methyltransferase
MKNNDNLHMTLEAASPTEIKSGGAGWRMTAGFGPTPFGHCLAAQGPRGVCQISYVDGLRATVWEELTQSWPNARWQQDDEAARDLLAGIFDPVDGPAAGRPLRAFVKGTEFQVRVWRALLNVLPGSLTTYSGLAATMGAPSAARAVGSAVAGNRLAWLIPCHRVVRRTGATGEYRWGAARKQAMIAWEQAAVQPVLSPDS